MLLPEVPPVLEGTRVRLEPLTQDHVSAFYEAAREWNLTRDTVARSIEQVLRQHEAGTILPFATVDKTTNAVVGGTRFLHIDPHHRRLEIGSSWLAAPWRRTGINTEAKFLMLRYAFEEMGFVRVTFVADARNTISRTAIERLGATQEENFCSGVSDPDGHPPDTVLYRIIASEWPETKTHIQRLMNRPKVQSAELKNSRLDAP